jgi:hypothetical protein
MAVKVTGLSHKIAIQLHLVAESSTVCSSRSRWSIWKLFDTVSYTVILKFLLADFCGSYPRVQASSSSRYITSAVDAWSLITLRLNLPSHQGLCNFLLYTCSLGFVNFTICFVTLVDINSLPMRISLYYVGLHVMRYWLDPSPLSDGANRMCLPVQLLVSSVMWNNMLSLITRLFKMEASSHTFIRFYANKCQVSLPYSLPVV